VQFAALVTVRDNPCLDQATLAGIIAYDRTTIGGVVDRLVDKGLVTRVTSDTDRRARVLTASDQGIAMIDRAEPAMRRTQELLVDDLDRKEAIELMRLMGRVVDALGEVTRASR
jgi:DNA-binding MarR family transcriptional regulator